MCTCDNVNGVYCYAHKDKARKEPHARKFNFKGSDLAFYIERLQILLDVINLDLAGNLEGVEDAQYWASVVYDLAKAQDYAAARRALQFFYGYIYTVPKSHRKSYKNYLTEVNNAL